MPAPFPAVNAGLLVLIWLVQIIIYPGMHGWDRARFADLHRSYTRRISAIVGPLMLVQAALAVRQIAAAPGPVPIVQAGLIGAVWGVTIFVSVPQHRILSAGYDAAAAARLVHTNWLRTVGWSFVSVLDWV